ncbi:hypothetical protein WR25_23624 [Diploscapter pachys]|uniref:Calmodulin-binding domain-containing protein n=1 Tax=Diploscapter pachys TaxID=2018661 RepID=A0A2A2J730_9BILA|nr:hypothetical protein WR25_23624 [Diploscapter pachys]
MNRKHIRESTAKMRFRMRKKLFIRRNKVCDISLLLAIAGLVFIIIDSELTALSSTTGIDKSSTISLFLRSMCVLTTVLLMGCLINYHAIEVKIALIDSGADDWRVALSMDRVIKLIIELIVCAICPFPGSGMIKWPYINSETRLVKMIDVPVDVLLSVPMFLRSYLLCRFMVLHSKQFQDAATRSIAALNRISMDFRFVIKTMMADHPLMVLIVFTVSYWICMSWMFTQCERYDGQLEVEHYYLNSMWFIMVTFMSIGYGDIVPNTYCGRTLSIATGIVGAGVSSALIAVISRKLELSRAEKHVNNFMADSKLTNQRKNAAASVLQETWFIHKYKKAQHKGDDLRLRHHQRRFLHSINEFRRIKWDQRKLQEKGNSLLDVGKLHSDMHETLWEMHRTQDHFIAQIDMLTQKIVELQNALGNQTLNLRPCCSNPGVCSSDQSGAGSGNARTAGNQSCPCSCADAGNQCHHHESGSAPPATFTISPVSTVRHSSGSRRASAFADSFRSQSHREPLINNNNSAIPKISVDSNASPTEEEPVILMTDTGPVTSSNRRTDENQPISRVASSIYSADTPLINSFEEV